jgi:hypothetical protein
MQNDVYVAYTDFSPVDNNNNIAPVPGAGRGISQRRQSPRFHGRQAGRHEPYRTVLCGMRKAEVLLMLVFRLLQHYPPRVLSARFYGLGAFQIDCLTF